MSYTRKGQGRERKDSDGSSQKFVYDLENSCNSICTNREESLVAAVGRKLFKVLKIFPDQFELVANLRDLPHKQINLNYSSNDVQWNPKDDAQLATAPTNGCVVLWDLNKRSKSKTCHIFENIHQRAVNKLSYHPHEPNILLSGSQDCTMNCLDSRSQTRTAEYKGPDSVRDVKFSPHFAHENYFAAAYENGMVQIWDRRFGESALKQWSFHNGPAYCCDWHPEYEQWIMSAGRDKMVKVCDITQGRVKEVYTVHALFSVARVKWRPFHKFHITSCSHILDNVVAIWDVRRPYIPYCSFAEHSDDVTDFLWLNDNVLLSCSKDKKLIQQIISEAERPADRATPTGLSFKVDGALTHACGDYLIHRNKPSSLAGYGSSRHPMQFRKNEGDPYQQRFLFSRSSLSEYTESDRRENQFVTCAKLYKLDGMSLFELCDHNHKVASDLGLDDIAKSWLVLKLLYCANDSEYSGPGFLQLKSASKHLPNRQIATECHDDIVRDTMKVEPSISYESPRGFTEEENEENITGDVSAVLDFFEYDHQIIDPALSRNLPSSQDWGELPVEAVQLRRDIAQRPLSPEHDNCSAVSASQSAIDSTASMQPDVHHYSIPKSQWDFKFVVKNMLQFYAEMGDVQTSVSATLVLGDLGKKLVSDENIEHWFSSYIEMLNRYKLFSIASLVTKLCPLSTINQSNQQSTTFNVSCGFCNRCMDKGGWQCDRCGKIFSICSVCHCTVKGIFVWCNLCGHGGHLNHLQEWYETNSHCPAGCNHLCLLGSSAV